MEGESKYKLEVENYQVKLGRQVIKILALLPAPNGTFVMLVISKLGCDSLLHIDSQGKQLFEHPFKQSIFGMAMISRDQVILPQTK